MLFGAGPSPASPPTSPRSEVWTANGTIRAIVEANGVIYLGGDFTQLTSPNGPTPTFSRNHLAALYASTGLPLSWNPNADGPVNTLALSPDGTILYVGGEFTHVGGQPRNRIAALAVATGLATAWNPNANGKVHAMVIACNVIYAGGEFSMIGGKPRKYIAALSAASGNAMAWDPVSGGVVRTMGLGDDEDTLYIGGDFTTIGGLARKYIAALDTLDTLTSAQIAKPWKPNANARLWTLLVAKDTIYVGGEFTSIGGEARNRIAALDAERNSHNALPWNPDANNKVTSLALSAGATLFAGGSFTRIGGKDRQHLAELNAADDIDLAASGNATAWNPSADSTVWALSRVGVALSTGGEFLTIGGNPRNALALFGTNSSQGSPQGGRGFWSQQPTWDPPIVPNNFGATHFDVDIRGISRMVTLDIDAEIDSLNLVEGGAVEVTQGSLFIAAAPGIQDRGTLVVGNGRSLLALVDITVSGLGPLRLNGPMAKLGVVAVPANPCWLNGAGHTIAGFGQIVGRFSNGGIVMADMPGEILGIDNPDVFMNSGLMQATNAGMLAIGDPGLRSEARGQPTLFNDGLIEAKDGGVVEIAGVAVAGTGDYLVDGGTLKLRADALFDASIAGTNLDVLNGGLVKALNDSTIDLAGMVTLSSGGAYQGAADSTASLTAQDIIVSTDGSLGGHLSIDGGMEVNGNRSVGIVGCGPHLARGCVPPVLSAAAMSMLTVGQAARARIALGDGDLTFNGLVQIDIGSNAIVTVYGNFKNECTDPFLFDWQGSLNLAGAAQSFELAGADVGPRNPAGFQDNFAMGTLAIAANDVVDFVDQFDNVPAEGCEALYVHMLTLGAGAAVRLHGCRVYYETLANHGASVTLEGGALMSTHAGDLNGDQAADLSDADIFANVLLGLDTDPAHVAAADLNGDGLIDGSDIAFMVEILTQ